MTQKRDQDLRTALERAVLDAKQIIGGNSTIEDAEADAQWMLQGVIGLKDRIEAALRAAPSRPVDAERVEPKRLEFLRREYVEYERDAKLSTVHGTALIGEFLDLLIHRQAALANKPTGTEAGRGVGAEDYSDLTWDSPIELPAEAGRGLAGQIMDAAWPEFGGNNLPADFWAAFSLAVWFTLAATPTSPVSPTPDSTGPAGALGSGSRKWGSSFPPATCNAYEDCAHDGVCHDFDQCQIKGPAEPDDEDDANEIAALTPSAPIADPVPERVRHLKRGTEYEVLGEAEAQVSDGMKQYQSNGAVRFIRDGDRLTVYRDPKNGKLWCRFTDEFRDGRFATVSPDDAQTQEGGR